MELTCQECQKTYYRKPSEVKDSKHCSKSCHNKVIAKYPKPSLVGKRKGNKHPLWKGEAVGYGALHVWIKRELGKIAECVYCSSQKNIQWASISHKAKRDLNDFIPLCQKCHAKYDDYVNKSWVTRRRVNL